MFGFGIYKGDELVFGVKIFKPDKDGELKYKEEISAKKCNKIYWTNFKSDPNRTGKQAKTGTKYHRVGVDLKECVEDNCKVVVEDPRRKTCSPECQKERLDRQRVIFRRKKLKGKTETTCRKCDARFMAARKDRVYCSKQCRYGYHNDKR